MEVLRVCSLVWGILGPWMVEGARGSRGGGVMLVVFLMGGRD